MVGIMATSLFQTLRTATQRVAVAAVSPHRSKRYATSLYPSQLAGLTEDQYELKDAVEQFAQAEIAPRAEEIDRTNTFPMARLQKIVHEV